MRDGDGKRKEKGERRAATLSQRRERKGKKGMSEGDGGKDREAGLREKGEIRKESGTGRRAGRDCDGVAANGT